MIDSYNKALAEFNRARSKEAGRRLNHHLRLFACPEGIRMDYDKLPVCVFTPDNKLTFVMTQDHIRRVAHSLCQMLYRHTSLALERKRQGVYQLWVSPRLNWNYVDRLVAPKYIYHEGLQFDLDTRTFLNPVTDPKENVIPDVRKVWLAHLREFKKQVLVRQKLGVLDTVMRTSDGKYHRIPDTLVLATIYEAMCSKQVTTEQLDTLAQYIRTTYYWYGMQPDSKETAARILGLCTQKFNYQLRQKFGVFGGS